MSLRVGRGSAWNQQILQLVNKIKSYYKLPNIAKCSSAGLILWKSVNTQLRPALKIKVSFSVIKHLLSCCVCFNPSSSVFWYVSKKALVGLQAFKKRLRQSHHLNIRWRSRVFSWQSKSKQTTLFMLFTLLQSLLCSPAWESLPY